MTNEIDEVRAKIGRAAKTAKRKVARKTRSTKKKTRRMTAAQRRQLSKKMKAAWARRKK